MLQAEMQMRHQAASRSRWPASALSSTSIESIELILRRGRSGTSLRMRITRSPSLRCRRADRAPQEVRSTPGQNHLVIAAIHQPLDLIHHHARRDRAGIAPAIGDDAEGAAVIAAILHLHIGPGPGAEPVDQVTGRSRSPT